MKVLAKIDNETLKITKGKIYGLYVITSTSLGMIKNDLNDNVIVSIYDFKEIE